MLGLLFDPEDEGITFLRNIELYGVTAQMMVFVIVTAVRTSNSNKILTAQLCMQAYRHHSACDKFQGCPQIAYFHC
jgi:hypothetical protein